MAAKLAMVQSTSILGGKAYMDMVQWTSIFGSESFYGRLIHWPWSKLSPFWVVKAKMIDCYFGHGPIVFHFGRWKLLWMTATLAMVQMTSKFGREAFFTANKLNVGQVKLHTTAMKSPPAKRRAHSVTVNTVPEHTPGGNEMKNV